MCGRATLVTPIDAIAEQLGVEPIPVGPPRYNIAPGQPVVVLRREGDGDGHAPKLALLDWGLRPFWAKRPFIQARAETIATAPPFRESFASRRCLVIVDGFYEWSSPPEGERQPHHVHRPDGRVFCIAGIWGGSTCAVVTTRARGAIAAIHDRMPLVVAPAERDAWLAGSADDATHVLDHGGAGAADLVLAPVSMRVNDVKNDDPGCLAPAGADDALPPQTALTFR